MQSFVLAQDEEPEPELFEEATTELEITEVTIKDITESSVIISWTTTVESDSTVNYGETTEFGMTVSDEEMITDHFIRLEDLSSASDYYLEIISCDPSNNCVTSDTYSFVTSELIATEEQQEEESQEIDDIIEQAAEGAGIAQENVEQAKTEATQKVTLLKRKGALVVTKAGIYQIYQIGMVRKLLTVSSTSRRVLPRFVELASIEGDNAELKIDDKIYTFRLGQDISADLDNDNIADLKIKLVSFSSTSTAKFFIRSIRAAIEIDTISFDAEEIFDISGEAAGSLLEKTDIFRDLKEKPNLTTTFIAVLIIGVLIVIGAGLYLFKKKK